jgi:hypothetical protein
MGRIFAPDGSRWWARQYALLPTPQVLDEKTLRIYFATLDDDRFGRIGSVDLDANDPGRILRIAESPHLDLGPLGSFDDSGVNPSCVVDINGKAHMYYIGWQRCARVPYMLFGGLAFGDRAGEFHRASSVPILDRTTAEPFSRSAPFVIADGQQWRMYYWSCVEWSDGPRGVHYNNVVRTVLSPDGVDWSAESRVCVAPDFVDEYSIGRPWVVREQGKYRMWYSVRSFSRLYSIGYAESIDGVEWLRRDSEAGMSTSAEGWDSEMICYPAIVDVAGKRYLFYNGNRHGATGFGYAVLES